jgi:hypothetical protein
MHLLPAIWCECRNAATKEMQALDLGLYPASDKMIRTVFTFQCLDDYLADSQECNTSAYHYNEKLRRLTNSSFPQTAPVILLAFHLFYILHWFRIGIKNLCESNVSGGGSRA